MTRWFLVIYHRRTFTGWTGSIMGCEQMNSDRRIQAKLRRHRAHKRVRHASQRIFGKQKRATESRWPMTIAIFASLRIKPEQEHIVGAGTGERYAVEVGRARKVTS